MSKKFDFYEMVNLTESLIQVIETESELLSKFKIKKIAELQGEKDLLIARLEEQRDLMESEKKNHESLTSDNINTLRRLADRYEDALSEYQVELFKASSVNEITVKIIADTVRDHVERNNGYGQNGTRAVNGKLYSPSAAIKINQQF
ncbi:MAG: hypothetical protein COV36_07240 [Alphaproteobacteria bacterium CG11_big_fil_rev_8_21_14_0_20_44_7]|nr:MAG: hypothetical protein COV36_07240 [Alphaproteobacteria bacterium CG11_big_fil_rev_8_21_14_0_20_44_7]